MFRTSFDRSKRQVSDIIWGSFDSVRYNQEKFTTENVSRKKPPVNNGTTISIPVLDLGLIIIRNLKVYSYDVHMASCPYSPQP